MTKINRLAFPVINIYEGRAGPFIGVVYMNRLEPTSDPLANDKSLFENRWCFTVYMAFSDMVVTDDQ